MKKTKEEMEALIPKDETIEQRILSLDCNNTNRLAIYNKYKQLDKLDK